MADASDPLGLAEVAVAAAVGAGGVDPVLLGDFLTTATEAVAAGTRIRRRELQRFARFGRQAASDGVPLRALIDLYLSAAWRLWGRLPTVDGPGPRDPVGAGEVMLRAVADVTAVLAEGYQLARRELIRAQEVERRDFVDDLLLGGSHSTSTLLDRAARFGLDLAGPHAVLVVHAERPFTDTSPLVGILERALLGAVADADALVVTREGRLVVVFAAPDRAASQEVVDRLVALLPGDREVVRLHRTADVGRWQLGLGRPRNGPAGVRLSFDEATEALELGRRFRTGQTIHDAADLLLHRVLVRDESAMSELVTAVLVPLDAARGGAGPLIATLTAYFDTGGNAAAAARALHLSPRAMTYRLAKIHTMTGLDPDVALDRFTLQTAVFGARLLERQS